MCSLFIDTLESGYPTAQEAGGFPASAGMTNNGNLRKSNPFFEGMTEPSNWGLNRAKAKMGKSVAVPIFKGQKPLITETR